MRCSNCAALLSPEQTRCPDCGAPRPQLLPAFAEAARRYALLRESYQAGAFDQQEYQSQLQQLIVVDEHNTHWMMGADGEWYHYEESQWAPREPPTVSVPVEDWRPRPISQPMVRPAAAAPQATEALEPSPAPVEPGPTPRKLPRWLWAAVGGGGFLLVAGLVVGVLALAGQGPFSARRTEPPDPTTSVLQVSQGSTPTVSTSPLTTPVAEQPTEPVSTTPEAIRAPTDALFSDDFSDPQSGWEIDETDAGSVGYGDGYYFIKSANADEAVRGTASRHYGDIVIDVEASPAVIAVTGDFEYGVGCRLQPNGDGYYLLVSGASKYGIFRVVAGQSRPLVDWTASTAVRAGGGTNHLRAMCNGSTLALIVNETLLTVVSDDTFTEGDVGFQVQTGGTRAAEVRFANASTEQPATVYMPAVHYDR